MFKSGPWVYKARASKNPWGVRWSFSGHVGEGTSIAQRANDPTTNTNYD